MNRSRSGKRSPLRTDDQDRPDSSNSPLYSSRWSVWIVDAWTRSMVKTVVSGYQNKRDNITDESRTSCIRALPEASAVQSLHKHLIEYSENFLEYHPAGWKQESNPKPHIAPMCRKPDSEGTIVILYMPLYSYSIPGVGSEICNPFSPFEKAAFNKAIKHPHH